MPFALSGGALSADTFAKRAYPFLTRIVLFLDRRRMSRFTLDELREYVAAWQPEVVAQVLDGLDRVGKRGQNASVAQKRRSERKAYSAIVVIIQNRAVRLKDGSRAKLPVMARNLSRSGLGLLAPIFFEPVLPGPESPTLQARNVFREGAALEIGLRKACGSMLWLYGSVMRARIVQHDFLDIGVRFNARINVLKALELDD